MGNIVITETGNTSNSFSGEGVEWDEFIPFIELRNRKGYSIEKDDLPLEKDKNGDYVFVDLLTQTEKSKKI